MGQVVDAGVRLVRTWSMPDPVSDYLVDPERNPRRRNTGERGDLPAPLLSRCRREPQEDDGEHVDDDADRLEVPRAVRQPLVVGRELVDGMEDLPVHEAERSRRASPRIIRPCGASSGSPVEAASRVALRPEDRRAAV